jgi:hypothetical protein
MNFNSFETFVSREIHLVCCERMPLPPTRKPITPYVLFLFGFREIRVFPWFHLLFLELFFSTARMKGHRAHKLA